MRVGRPEDWQGAPEEDLGITPGKDEEVLLLYHGLALVCSVGSGNGSFVTAVVYRARPGSLRLLLYASCVYTQVAYNSGL